MIDWRPYPKTSPRMGTDCIVLTNGGKVFRAVRANWHGGWRNAGGDPKRWDGGVAVQDVTHYTPFEEPKS